MDDELKVVVTSVLEADEAESAQRITAQLPNIAKRINEKSTIKVGISLNDSNIQTEAQRVTKSIQKAIPVQDVDIRLRVTQDAKNMLSKALDGLNVSDEASKAMLKNLTNMKARIDDIDATWVKVGKTKERLLQLSIKTTDADKRTVSVIQQYDQAGKKVESTTKRIHLGIQAQREEQEKLSQQAEKDNQARLTYINQQEILLDNLKASYGDTAKSKIVDADHLADVQAKIEEITSQLEALKNSTGNVSSETKNQIATLQAKLQRLVTGWQNVEQAEQRSDAQAKKDNQARLEALSKYQIALDKIRSSYTGETSVKPLQNAENLEDVESKYQAINTLLETLRNTSGKLSSEQRVQLNEQINELKELAKGYQNVEYIAVKLQAKNVYVRNEEAVNDLKEYEEGLKSSGILTESFKKKIDTLREQLKDAFDRESLTKFGDGFSTLTSEVGAFQARVNTANAEYKNLIAAEKEISKTEKEIAAADAGSGEKAALEQKLALQKENRAEVLKRLQAYEDIKTYCQGAVSYTQAQKTAEAEAAVEAGKLADQAAVIDKNFSEMEIRVMAVESGMKRVGNAPDTLISKVQNLKTLLQAVQDATSAEEKIAAYKELQEEIAGCNKQITLMRKIEGGDIFDSRFTANLEKAKADLETIGRTWSALHRNSDLDAQFQQLSERLKTINNQMDLNKWTAQFSAFKSEVKAAGLNMQSLGDTLKNNVGKVIQWVSATTLLFRAFRLLRSAVSTVIDLDTAMIDLRKTTSATEAEYAQFYKTANSTAKELGQTTEAIISQTAEWSRLGYTMQEAAELAKNSAIFASVSPGMDTDTATDGLVSIIKAYDIDVNDSLDGIISKINAVGNAFAVSNEDIVEVMTRASSAMAAANNTFEETVALGTAAVEITRDASTVGNALKTISMRIRGYDEDTEEYSEDVAELTGTIADLTKVASNGNVGISLFEPGDPDTYRSTYDILSDIADIWEELTDKNRASLLEALFGKRQAQVGAAMLSNFDQARASIETMAKSAGSAEAEMEKIEQSLEYKLNALKETWVGVSQNLFQTDDIGLVIDALTALSNIVDALTSRLGLFGSITVGGVIAWLAKLKTTVGKLKNRGVSKIVPTYALAATRNELAA
jgi:TP901 family phage tail tape measure protein